MDHAYERPHAETGSFAHESRVLVPGAAAGLVGGIAMAGWMVFCAALEGLDPFSQIEPMGAVFKDSDAVARGARDLAYGVALYLAYAAVGGVVFKALIPRDFPPGSGAVAGVGFAMVLMAFSTSMFLPAINPTMRERMVTLGGSWVLGYAVYGLFVGLGPWLGRRLSARTANRAAQRRAAHA